MTVAVIGILAALAVPSLMRAKMSGNEVSALGSLKAINAAESAYSATAAAGGYATQLSVLGAACPGSSQAFISPELAADPSMKSGYSMVLAAGASAPGPTDCNGTPSRSGYYLTATPDQRRERTPRVLDLERPGHLLRRERCASHGGRHAARRRSDADSVNDAVSARGPLLPLLVLALFAAVLPAALPGASGENDEQCVTLADAPSRPSLDSSPASRTMQPPVCRRCRAGR